MKRRVARPRKSEKFSGPRTLDFQIRSLFCQGRCEASNRQSLETPTDPCKSVGGFPLFCCVFFGLHDGAAIPPEGACDGRTTAARGSEWVVLVSFRVERLNW